MRKLVLISAAFTDAAHEHDFIECCADKLRELGLHCSMNFTPDSSVIVAAQLEAARAPVELPVPTEQPTPAEDPKRPREGSVTPEPAEVEVEVEAPAGKVEVEVPVRLEACLLDIGAAVKLECRPIEADVSRLSVLDLRHGDLPGVATFTLFDLNYKFGLDENGFIDATISVNGRTKRTKLKLVPATEVGEPPHQLLLGKNDAELLRAGGQGAQDHAT